MIRYLKKFFNIKSYHSKTKTSNVTEAINDDYPKITNYAEQHPREEKYALLRKQERVASDTFIQKLSVEETQPLDISKLLPQSKHAPETVQQLPLNFLESYIRQPEFKRLLFKISQTTVHGKALQNFAVLSEFPGEGRSFVSAVLALGFVRILKKRVLLMSTVEQHPQNAFTFGSSDYLLDASKRYYSPDIISTSSFSSYCDVHAYSSLSGAAKNIEPAEFILSPFLTALAPSYDMIILDTCPLSKIGTNNFDPIIVASFTQGALLVLGEKSISSSSLAHTKEKLSGYGVEVIGSIVNKITNAQSKVANG
jgi:Mrp family chromosome partitioning ATPase